MSENEIGEASVLFSDVRIFDGVSAGLSAPSHVLVRGNAIAAVSAQPIPAEPGEQQTEIDGAGRVLMPGLIDAHAHVAFTTVPTQVAMTADATYLGYRGVLAARDMLMRGFTSVRDAGGPVFGIKRAIDEGLTPGCRIWPSGAFVSQTSGHGDFRMPYETPRGCCGPLSHTELMGASVIADGAGEVLRGVREQLMHGASQIKMMAGGGVSSAYDPIDVTQYTEAELRAGVEAAEDWGTYVMVHAYTDRAVTRAINAGVACIDHGQLVDEKTVAMMAERGVWWSLQPFLADEHANPKDDPRGKAKQREVAKGTDNAYRLAIKHQVKVAWGTDTLFDARIATMQGAQLAKMTRWFTAAEVLSMATSANAELLALSGARNPYPGKLGVVEEGALADLLLVDGNPLDDIGLLAKPDTSLAVIMKDGQVYKNLLAG